ncbi:MAG: HEAT repeat domain-containing protein [Acidobacteriota bacterium]
MRKLLPLIVIAFACATPPPIVTEPPPAEPHGFTIEEEAAILRLEDRREHDPVVVNAWIAEPNVLHRLRIAQALGRIGPHTHTGVPELAKLAADPDRRVREMVAFSLGEIGDPSAQATVMALTDDSDSSVGAEAVEALSKLTKDKTLLPRYLAIADSASTEGVRSRAVRYLFRWDDDTASEAARRALGAPSSAVRQEAAYALARRAYPPAREELLLLMNDTNTLTRAYAASALGRIADAAAFPALLAALGDAHPWVRTNAGIALGRVLERAPAGGQPLLRADDLPRVFATAEDSDPGVRSAMIDTLAYYAATNETAKAHLINTFRNGTQWERELAAGAIAKHLPWSEAATLLTALTPWQIVRVLEATAAAPQGPALRQLYASHEQPLVRSAVLSAIPDDQADAEIDMIRSMQNDADVIVRAGAYDRLGFSKNPPLDVLRQAEERERGDATNDARLAAIASIAKAEFPERAAFLQSLVGDRDPVVRRTVAELVNASYTPLPIEMTPEQYAEIVRWARQPHTATIHMTRGNIKIALLTQDAPMTTWNFAQLAQKKYFDNTSFMRVVPNFVIQGGDPRNDMNGGPGYAIRDEINLQKYTRGAVGMALSGPDTGGSQFFITHSPQPHLDGGYTIFGRVSDGMTSTVDQTERGDRVVTITIDEPSSGR